MKQAFGYRPRSTEIYEFAELLGMQLVVGHTLEEACDFLVNFAYERDGDYFDDSAL